MSCPYTPNSSTAFWGAQGQQSATAAAQYESYENQDVLGVPVQPSVDAFDSFDYLEAFEAAPTGLTRTSYGSRSIILPRTEPGTLESEVAAQVDAQTGCTQAVRAMCVQNECSTAGDVQTKLRCAACGPCVVPGPPTCTPSMIKYCTKMRCATASDMTRGACRGCEPCTVPNSYK